MKGNTGRESAFRSAPRIASHHPRRTAPFVLQVSGFILFFFSTLPAETLRIATFNLKWLTERASETRMAPWKSEEELDAHRRALADILAKVDADIVCVQEVTTRAALEHLAAEPALRLFRYRVLHVESEDKGTGQDVAFLVAPHVRLNASAGAAIRRFADTLAGRPATPRSDPRRQRLTKHALICLESPRVCLLGLHLLAHPDHPGRTAQRETQARIAAHIVRTEIAAKGYAPIVLGDLNDFDPDVPGTPEAGNRTRRTLALIKNYDTTRPGNELFNTARRIEPAEARYASWWDRNRNRRRDSTDPVSLVDHILLDHTLERRVRTVGIRHDLHDGSVSDHWPVVVEISAE